MITFPGISSVIKNYNFSENAFLPSLVTVPLVMEKDAPCKPVVSKGDIVAEGDVIAVPESHSLRAKIHSPVPGVVEDIVSVLCPNGKPEIAVKIRMKGSFSYLGKKPSVKQWENLLPKSITEKLAEYGVLNTYYVTNPVSLSYEIDQVSKKTKKCLIVRMFDEDPVRITDSLVTKLYLEEVKKGAYITARALNADGILYVFGADFLSKEEIGKAHDMEKDEKVLVMNTRKYPCGYKKEVCNLFKKSFKKEKSFSVREDDLFVDASTMYEVYKAIELDTPVIDKKVHFSGNCLKANCFLNVKIGTSLKNVVEQLGGFDVKPYLIVINGHMTGYSVQSLDVPITKYIKSVAFLSKNRKPDQYVYECISCGNCRNICSRGLTPDLLYRYKTENFPLPEEYILSAASCAECSMCNTVCPSRIPLSQIISSIRQSVNVDFSEEEND